MAGPTRQGMAAAAAFPPAAWSAGGESSGSTVKAAMQGCGARRQGAGPCRGLRAASAAGGGAQRVQQGRAASGAGAGGCILHPAERKGGEDRRRREKEPVD